MRPAQESRQTRIADATDHPKAFHSRWAVIVFLLTAVAGLAGDLVSKEYVFDALLGERADLAEDVRAEAQRLSDHLGRPPASREVLRHLNVHRPLALGVELTLSTNPGVVFGMPMQRAAVVVATLVTVAIVGVFFATSPARRRWMHVALGLVLAGALGNLYDRLFATVTLPGIEPIRRQVRDFIDFSAWHYPWVFNIADALLVVGVAIIILHGLVDWRRAADARPKAKG